MDSEGLHRVSEQVVKCVLAQDTTDLWDILHPKCELRYGGASLTLSGLESTKASATAASSGGNKTSGSLPALGRSNSKPFSGGGPGASSALGASQRGGGQQQQQGAGGGRGSVASHSSSGPTAQQQQQSGALYGNASAIGGGGGTTTQIDATTMGIVGGTTKDGQQAAKEAKPQYYPPPPGYAGGRGSRFVGEATAKIYRWMNLCQCIADPTSTIEVRRKRKPQEDAQSAIGRRQQQQQQQAGGPTMAPLTNAQIRAQHERERQADEEDPTRLSKVVVTYGRPKCLVEDVNYVNEDGKICLIIRSFLFPQDPNDKAHIKHRNALLAAAQPRMNAMSTTPPVLDFSFSEIKQPLDLLRMQPRAEKPPKRHEVKPVEEIKEDKDDKFPAGQNPNQMPSQGVYQLIKVKNTKTGEEEAYEFKDHSRDKVLLDKDKEKEKNDPNAALKNLAAALQTKFDATSIRLSENIMVDASGLVPVLRSLVVNYYLTITWLDLSRSKVQVVPNDLHKLPLTTIYLHDNDIKEWTEVDKLLKLPKLTSVTLFANPIATKTPDYKLVALESLLQAPNKEVPLKSFDFVALTGVDYHLTMMHNQFHSRDPPRLSPRNMRQYDTPEPHPPTAAAAAAKSTTGGGKQPPGGATATGNSKVPAPPAKKSASGGTTAAAPSPRATKA